MQCAKRYAWSRACEVLGDNEEIDDAFLFFEQPPLFFRLTVIGGGLPPSERLSFAEEGLQIFCDSGNDTLKEVHPTIVSGLALQA